MRKLKKEIALAVVGCGVVGRIRTMLARDFLGVSWVCDLKENLAKELAEDAGADFWTTDYKELLLDMRASRVLGLFIQGTSSQ